ncbi:LPXTG cell wall anchor domain-containing protein [Enterococcus faecium]|nr:LPXTG cell wall anchor domain-containing protein [Enterococcus faecium]
MIKNKLIYCVLLVLFLFVGGTPAQAFSDTYENKASVRFFPSDDTNSSNQKEELADAQEGRTLPQTGEKKQNGLFLGVSLISLSVFIFLRKSNKNRQ